MRRSHLKAWLALTLLAATGAACGATLTAQQAREDFALARRALEEVHAGLYRYTPKAQLDRVFDAAASGLDHPMDELQLLRVLAPAVAAVRCGHTALRLSPALKAQREQALLLPLNVSIVRGRLYILRDFARTGALAGREIVSLNGVPSAAVIARLDAATAGDGFIATGRARDVAHTFKELLYAHFGMQGKFALGLRAPQGRGVEQMDLDGQPYAALKALAASRYPQDRPSDKFAQLSFFDDGKIARLQVFNFSDREEAEEGPTILKKAFASMAAKGTQTLLLDLRDNGGGEDALGKRLFSYLVDAPFPYYQDLMIKRPGLSFAQYVEGEAGVPADALVQRPDGLYAPRKHPNLGIQQPAQATFKGKVIALINGWSFSTTAELITQLHDKRRASFVGEESGGAYHGNTSGGEVTLVLPNSGLRVHIPLMAYTLAVSGQHAVGRGVVPEVEVLSEIEDQLSGRDPQMERALAMARFSQAR
ncbi:MAG: S41 family peptidase [Pseudomonadota bacterium]